MTAALKLLGWQGIAGIAVALVLSILLAVQKAETRHWRKQSDAYQQLYNGEKSALETTVANYRVAAAKAQADDKANAARVSAQQAQVSKEQSDEYEARLAAARVEYQRLRLQSQAAADPGARRSAPMPGLPAPSSGPPEATCENGLSDALTATCQAIRLDELIKWVERQHAIETNK